MINYIPNDPLAQHAMPIRGQTARPDRPAQLAGFEFSGVFEEGRFPEGTREFLYWQCREAALAAIDTWESLTGPLTNWVKYRKYLRLRHNRGQGLQASYNRRHLSFYEHTSGERTTFSGASADVVGHECGHAFLDVLQPAFYKRDETEIAAFHEAFGDCIAILMALIDPVQRQVVLQESPDLLSPNFLESWGEDLADGVRRARGNQDPSSVPRQLRNQFQWQLPETLPPTGPPGELSRSPHSFSQIFSGSFYDTIANIFSQSTIRDASVRLSIAAEAAGKLLVDATQRVLDGPRLFQAVGQQMVLVDKEVNAGANVQAIRNAFARHGIRVASDLLLSPIATLAGPSPNTSADAANILSRTTRHDLAARMRGDVRQRLAVSLKKVAGQSIVQASQRRAVELDKLDRRLKGVIAYGHEMALVGGSGMRAAMLSAPVDPRATTNEVVAFVETLLAHDCIDFGKSQSRVAVNALEPQPLPTHAIRKIGDKKVLTRVQFACPQSQALSKNTEFKDKKGTRLFSG